ncbi:MAG: BrnT family toxin [Vampirovibrionia bacterium]
MEFIWDSEKAKSNLKKHKVSFDEAITVFYDPLARITDDPDHSIEEERLIIIGYSQKSNLLFVVHVYKESEQIIRIISARKASLRERLDFENIVHGGY